MNRNKHCTSGRGVIFLCSDSKKSSKLSTMKIVILGKNGRESLVTNEYMKSPVSLQVRQPVFQQNYDIDRV